MAHFVTLLLWLVAIAAVFGIVFSNRSIHDYVEDILTQLFEKT